MPKSKKLGKNKVVSFEEKLKKLRGIVNDLEEGDVPLKKSIDNYQKSLELIKQCYEELENAELKIEKVMKKEGKIVTKPLDD